MDVSDRTEDESLVVRKLIQDGRFEDAFARARPLARAGSISVQIYLGHLYHAGTGIPKDLDEAERWYRLAYSDSSSPIAAHKLARLYYDKHQLQESYEWLEKAAAADYPASIYQLGRLHLLGIGVPRDATKGWRYIESAARQGHVWARRLVALDLVKGHRGIRQIPRALPMMWRTVRDYVRIELEGVHTELTHRGW